MKRLTEQETDRLQTKARAATTLRAELDSLQRCVRQLSRLTIEGRLRSLIDRYDYSTGARIPQGTEENAQTDYGRSAVADVASQVCGQKNPKGTLKERVFEHLRGVSSALIDQKVHEFCAAGRPIDAIKYVRETAQVGLKEAKEYVDLLRGL